MIDKKIKLPHTKGSLSVKKNGKCDEKTTLKESFTCILQHIQHFVNM
jgi:hypothetical protein